MLMAIRAFLVAVFIDAVSTRATAFDAAALACAKTFIIHV
jgi:hypothetical protein